MRTKLILVGGFLGSGKTTLLWEAARLLTKRGKSVGLVTNDQAPDLVDTAFLSRSGAGIREVSGSCFCCNLDGFIAAVQSLIDQQAEIIIAEPVGSCTDISATIMQPVKDRHPEIDLAPLTVLADPGRVREVLQKSETLMHASALYILRLQMEEADRILLNKSDTLSPLERKAMLDLLSEAFPQSDVNTISAKTGEGLDAWLETILADTNAGQRIVEVDYDRYAEGEAVLGWLNAMVGLNSKTHGVDWGSVIHALMERMHAEFRQRHAEIGHLKLALIGDDKEGTANLIRLGGEIVLHNFDGLSGKSATLILNARVQIEPAELEAIVRESIAVLDQDGISATIQTLRCLKPGRPKPTFRYSHVARQHP